MECLEGVCHESGANRANQESWLVGEKTLTLLGKKGRPEVAGRLTARGALVVCTGAVGQRKWLGRGMQRATG